MWLRPLRLRLRYRRVQDMYAQAPGAWNDQPRWKEPYADRALAFGLVCRTCEAFLTSLVISAGCLPMECNALHVSLLVSISGSRLMNSGSNNNVSSLVGRVGIQSFLQVSLR
jgi:hypothetical protein